MAKLKKNGRIVGRTQKFVPVFGNRLLIPAKAGVGVAEMIMTKRNVGLQPQRLLELLDRQQAAIRILIRPPEQHMRKSRVRVDLDSLLEFARRLWILILRELHQRDIEMDVGATAVQVLSTPQSLQRVLVLALLEVSQPKPVLQLGVQ